MYSYIRFKFHLKDGKVSENDYLVILKQCPLEDDVLMRYNFTPDTPRILYPGYTHKISAN